MDSRDQSAAESAAEVVEALRAAAIHGSYEFDAAAILKALAAAEYFGRVQLPEPPKRDRCVSCSIELTPVFPDSGETSQYDNALEVKLEGGYGMFFDNIDGDHHVFLCHDCAHNACLKFPWLDRLIHPEKSHGHTVEFWEFNNGHLGWDKPAAVGLEGETP